MGFKEIQWDLMKPLLEIKTAGIFFTFMTHAIARHRSNVKAVSTYEEPLVQFYGNKKQLSHTKGNDLMESYKLQMAEFCKRVFDVPA